MSVAPSTVALVSTGTTRSSTVAPASAAAPAPAAFTASTRTVYAVPLAMPAIVCVRTAGSLSTACRADVCDPSYASVPDFHCTR